MKRRTARKQHRPAPGTTQVRGCGQGEATWPIDLYVTNAMLHYLGEAFAAFERQHAGLAGVILHGPLAQVLRLLQRAPRALHNLLTAHHRPQARDASNTQHEGTVSKRTGENKGRQYTATLAAKTSSQATDGPRSARMRPAHTDESIAIAQQNTSHHE